MIDTIWFNLFQRFGPNWRSQISYEAVASILSTQSVCIVLMCLHSIATEHNGTQKAAHANIDDDRYDMDEYGAAGQPRLDLSDQLRGCSIASEHAIRLSSANVIV